MKRHHPWSCVGVLGIRSAGLLLISVSSVLAAEACITKVPTVDTTYATDGNWKRSNGYGYYLFHDGNGTAKLTAYDSGAAFKGEWSNAGDFLAGVGLVWNNTKTFDQYGPISADFAFTKSGSGVPYSYIGIHGYSSVANIEYYIVEDWIGPTPAVTGMTLKGNLVLDGGIYKIYLYDRHEFPSIGEVRPPNQYFSIRQTPRQCGHVSVSDHFKKWDSLGMTLGKLYDVQVLVEAGGGAGSVDFTSASVTEARSPTALRSEPLAMVAGVASLVALDGTVVRRWSQNSSSATVPMGALPRGVYFLRTFAEGGGSLTRRVVVE